MPIPSDAFTFTLTGKCSSFGGPQDNGMRLTEGVALYDYGSDDPHSLFLPGPGRLGRNLDPRAPYCAMRFLYGHHSPSTVRGSCVLVRALHTGLSLYCFPADWGPAAWTHRIIDLSPGALQYLGLKTDDTVMVTGLWQPPVIRG